LVDGDFAQALIKYFRRRVLTCLIRVRAMPCAITLMRVSQSLCRRPSLSTGSRAFFFYHINNGLSGRDMAFRVFRLLDPAAIWLVFADFLGKPGGRVDGGVVSDRKTLR
jgi:hypothetical protein